MYALSVVVMTDLNVKCTLSAMVMTELKCDVCPVCGSDYGAEAGNCGVYVGN